MRLAAIGDRVKERQASVKVKYPAPGIKLGAGIWNPQVFFSFGSLLHTLFPERYSFLPPPPPRESEGF